jgi:DnaJ-class molecular chaperone
MKKLFLIFALLIGVSVFAGEYHGITKESKMKKYNKHAVWRKVSCKRCHGTGSETVVKRDYKTNKTLKYQKPCLRCKGRGYIGMSKY